MGTKTEMLQPAPEMTVCCGTVSGDTHSISKWPKRGYEPLAVYGVFICLLKVRRTQCAVCSTQYAYRSSRERSRVNGSDASLER